LLILEGFQAGLSWAIILKKRKAFRQAFHQFDPQKVAQMTNEELKALEKNREIIRNKKKIAAARQNAQVFLRIQKEFGSFNAYVWPFVGGKPKVNHWKQWSDVPCLSEESQTLSHDLKKRGMTFVGPKIIYSYLQAAGLINDHLVSCPKNPLF
ncbi:MAG: DNA-3-methyladenine glycosylase I, partial [Chlamydiia bacterium]|nr:DNA-3-methyladenine glycosylase I [Chlamydiia bacterium]